MADLDYFASPSHPKMRDLELMLPPPVFAKVFGIARRTVMGPAKFPPPYICVVFQNKHVLRFREGEWLDTACIARICLEAP
jgi:hypothetical protein